MIKATSATVRNLTSLRGVSLAIELPLPYEAEHLTGFGAPVTYVSRVSPAQKRATPSIASLLLLFRRIRRADASKILAPLAELRLSGASFTCYQLTSVTREQHRVNKPPGWLARPAFWITLTSAWITLTSARSARAGQIRHGMCS